MSTRYESITLARSVAWLPGWTPGTGKTRDCWQYAAPRFEIWRADGDCVYKVVDLQTGEAIEVPVSSARNAVMIGEAAAAAERRRRAEAEAKAAKGGK